MARKISGTVTMMASYRMNLLISSTGVLSSMMSPGTEAPMVMDRSVAKMPVKVTRPACSLLNQLTATLLGVFKIKIFPMAAEADPRRQ